MVNKQIEVLNKFYNSSNLSFQLKNTSHTINATWFDKVAPSTYVQVF
jgi:hypothetical protein